jgi:hypothetical protein
MAIRIKTVEAGRKVRVESHFPFPWSININLSSDVDGDQHNDHHDGWTLVEVP